MANGRTSKQNGGGKTARQPRARKDGDDRPTVAQLSPLPISQREIHMVLDALGVDLAQLFEKVEA